MMPESKASAQSSGYGKADYVGRFAPSPTGPLHLGSLATALASWLDAAIHGGRWLLRIEDIDSQRCNQVSTEHILRTLRRHGLCWLDEPWVQSSRSAIYQQYLEQLIDQRCVYPCACTRAEIEAVNSGRPVGHNRVYPGTCKNGMPNGRAPRSFRFSCSPHPIMWTDFRLGTQIETLKDTSGDFVLKRGDGLWAYHLAVVVDDIESKVTHIVRGEDLTTTTARQVALYQALGRTIPHYWHLPVILAEDGQKLSKQTGALAVPEGPPCENLNAVWAHFGMPTIAEIDPTRWLEMAKPGWAEYRARIGSHRKN